MIDVRELRKEKGITIANLADSIHVKTSTLTNYLNGTRPMPSKVAYSVAKQLEVSIEDVLGLEPLNNPSYKEAPNRIKEYRKKVGKTLDQMELETDIKRGTFNNYENGVTDPNIKTWYKLAVYFHTTIEDLAGF